MRGDKHCPPLHVIFVIDWHHLADVEQPKEFPEAFDQDEHAAFLTELLSMQVSGKLPLQHACVTGNAFYSVHCQVPLHSPYSSILT